MVMVLANHVCHMKPSKSLHKHPQDIFDLEVIYLEMKYIKFVHVYKFQHKDTLDKIGVPTRNYITHKVFSRS